MPRKPTSRPAKRAAAPPLSAALKATLARVMQSHDEALATAQGIAFDAMQAPSAASRYKLAADALALSPLCADAWGLLAAEAPNATPLRMELLLAAAAAGRLAIGLRWVLWQGEFWGILETRPYMRARLQLMFERRRHGVLAEAIADARELLRLNPNDNQGVRHLLIHWHIENDDNAAATALLADYADDGSAVWEYAAALLAFRRDPAQADATAARAAALENNPHLAKLLRQPSRPKAVQDMYSPGSREEALCFIDEVAPAWDRTPGAVAWLGERPT